jgi:hypothetical protein
MTSPADTEIHLFEPSPVQEQLNDLCQNLKRERDLLPSPPVTDIAFNKLVVNQTFRKICRKQVLKLKSPMEKSKFDWDSTIFAVVRDETCQGEL